MRTSFVKKITSFVAAFFIIIIVVHTYVIVTAQHDLMLRSAIEEKEEINRLLAIMFEASEATTGIAYRSYLVEKVNQVMDVVYFRMVKPTGEIYLSTNKAELGNIVNDPLIFTKETVVEDDVYEGENIKVVVSPASRAYTLWLGFSLERVHSAINSIIIYYSVISVTSILLALAVSYVISNRMVRPVKELTEGIELIRKGELEHEIEVRTEDEIGQLASAFNQMTRDLKASRDKLEESQKGLEKKVKERTKELGRRVSELKRTKMATLNILEDLDKANKELEKKQKQIIAANRELKKLDLLKSEFMNVAAHELKTPLIPIVGYLDMIQESPRLGEVEKQEIAICLRNAKRLQRLVQDVLDISKLESKAMKFEMQELDVAEVIKNARADMRGFAEEKGLNLRCELPDRPLWVYGDKQRLTQVLANLVDNAIKFTDKGSVTIRAGLKEKEVLVSVEDNGIGITKKDMPRLFDKFFQADASTKRKYGGTGLGLAISKSIVEAHGGRIRVKSKPGEGSTFTFSLPFKPKF
ncbi:MAG: ATP-binding protein [Candidatus Aenigmatarchaeota archaeon]